MLILDIFLYTWIGLIFCMCSRLCYEEHQQRHPDTRINFQYIKRKTFGLFYKSEPLITENELCESVHVDNDPETNPPRWVHPD